MRFNRSMIAGAAVAGVLALTGSAFTAGNTVGGDNYAGYGTATVTGAVTEGIEHTLSADGTKIESTLLTFTTDLTAGHQVEAGFGTTALESCTVSQGVSPALDTATCTYAAGGYTTADATDFRVAVS